MRYIVELELEGRVTKYEPASLSELRAIVEREKKAVEDTYHIVEWGSVSQQLKSAYRLAQFTKWEGGLIVGRFIPRNTASLTDVELLASVHGRIVARAYEDGE